MIKPDERSFQRALFNCESHDYINWQLVARTLSLHQKRARYLVNKWHRQGLIDWNRDGSIRLTAKAETYWKPLDMIAFNALINLFSRPVSKAFEARFTMRQLLGIK